MELAADPFTALRVTYGMLLGEADFEVLMGNPRGKGMLHAAWLHGSGLIWGLGVTWTPPAAGSRPAAACAWTPGLAIDGWGRELRLDAARCLGPARVGARRGSGGTRTRVTPARGGTRRRGPGTASGAPWRAGWSRSSATCLDNPVPALADPCDVTRQHDMCSRVVETLQLTVRETAPRRRRTIRGCAPCGSGVRNAGSA